MSGRKIQIPQAQKAEAVEYDEEEAEYEEMQKFERNRISNNSPQVRAQAVPMNDSGTPQSGKKSGPSSPRDDDMEPKSRKSSSSRNSEEAVKMFEAGGDILSEHPVGLSEVSIKYSTTHDAILSKNLMPGETVLGQFNVYFPDFYYPMWYVIFWSCITLGGFFLFRILPRMIMQFFYKIRCCTPAKVEHQKGLMVITNFGRIIVWRQSGTQIKQPRGKCFNCCCLCFIKCCCPVTCAAPVKYEMVSDVKIYSAAKIRQMSQYYHSFANCMLLACLNSDYGCCFEFSAGIELSFNAFNHEYNNEDASKFFDISKGVITTKSVSEYLVEGMLNFKQKITAFKVDPVTVIRVYTNTYDIAHAGDMDSVLEDCNKLQKDILDALTGFLPEIIVPSEVDRVDLEQGKFINVPPDRENDVAVISDDGKVSLPRSYFPMLEDEEIISTIGQVFRLTWVDFLMFWKFCTLRKKKFTRSLLILTNKRIVEFYLVQRRGALPNGNVQAEYSYSSYFPGRIHCGFMISEGKKVTASNRKKVPMLEVQLLTDAGVLVFDFKNGQEALPFAKALQMTPGRLAAAKSLHWGDQLPEMITNFEANKLDWQFIPSMASEQFLARFQGTSPLAPPEFMPFCANKYIIICWQKLFCIENKLTKGVCSEEGCPSCFFPYGIYCLTCALRPFIRGNEILVSNSTIYFYEQTRNYGICGFKTVDGGYECSQGPCVKLGDFKLAWAPISDFNGYQFENYVDTNDDCFHRICADCCGVVGAACYPIAKTKYKICTDVGVTEGTFKFELSGEGRNHNFNEDTDLDTFMRFLDSVQKSQFEGAETPAVSGLRTATAVSTTPRVPPSAVMTIQPGSKDRLPVASANLPTPPGRTRPPVSGSSSSPKQQQSQRPPASAGGSGTRQPSGDVSRMPTADVSRMPTADEDFAHSNPLKRQTSGRKPAPPQAKADRSAMM